MDLVCLNFSQFIISGRDRVMDSQSVVKTSHPMFNVAGAPPPPPPPPPALQDISPTQNHSTSQDKNGVDDAEISIFEAHKYFSEDSNGIKTQLPSHVQRLSSVSSVKSLRKASSEASWNSRTGLLSNPPGSTGVSLKNLVSRRWSAAKKWLSRRNCCCTGHNSLGVKEVTQDSEHREPIVLIDSMKSSKLHTDGDQSQRCSITEKVVEIHHIKAMATASSSSASSSSSMDAPRQQRISATGRPFIDAFTFPILNSSSDQATTSPPSLKPIVAKSTVNPLENAVMESFQMSRPSSMEIHASARGASIAREDDVGSDCSSDLFEIESFSTQTTSCPMQMHCWWESVDENSSNAITNLQYCRRSVDELVAAADICNGEAEQTKGQRRLMQMSSTQEKATVVKCVAEGPPLIPLHVTVPRGTSPSSPLSLVSKA